MASIPRVLPVLVLVLLAAPVGWVQAVDGVHYGNGNLPEGCVSERPPFKDGCYHMRTDLNNLDTPVIDVLLVTPVSPYAERDLRTMRQSMEMWADGIHYLAPQLGLDWLSGVEFNVVVDDGSLDVDAAWDPEIIVVAANPVVAGVQGIGIDPIDFVGNPITMPCRGANPLASIDAWKALPGFDGHHDRSGTYVEECEGGGSVCYAVNLAIDPVPGVVDDVLGMNMFDLVSHEVGHCLSVGHVGDAGDHKAAAVPVDDIMAYTHNREPGKCVSSLDVEAFAARMSRFLLPTPLVVNDAKNPNGPFVVQHPRDHFYASETGLAEDCPVPDLGIVGSGERVDFTPTGGLKRTPPALDVTSHADGDAVAAGAVLIEGTVTYGPAKDDPDGDGVADVNDVCPGVFDPRQSDADADGIGDACDPTMGAFPSPDGTITGGITIFSDLNPVAAHNEIIALATGPAGDPKPKFLGGEPVTFQSRFTKAPDGLVTVGQTTFTWHVWDAEGNLVRTAPCTVNNDTTATSSGFNCKGKTTMPTQPGRYYATAKLDGADRWITDTPQDDKDHPGLKGFEVLPLALPNPPSPAQATTVRFEDDGEPVNTFYPEDSTLGVLQPLLGSEEKFTLELGGPSRVTVRLTWTGTGTPGTNDLDLRASGAATASSARRATTAEQVTFARVGPGELTLTVVPFLVTDPVRGTTYTLVAEVEPLGDLDTDGDGVFDAQDVCPGTAAGTPVDAQGCPIRTERVVVLVDGVEQASETVMGRGGDAFALPLDLSGRSGPVEVTVAWYEGIWLVRERTLTLEVV